MKVEELASTGQWLLAIVAAGVSITVYVFNNFTTVREYDHQESRLNRIEQKVDKILERLSG